MSVFQRYLSTKIHGSKKHIYEIYYCYIRDYTFVIYVAVYVLVLLEEEYSLIWKAKPLTIQTDKGKWEKN